MTSTIWRASVGNGRTVFHSTVAARCSTVRAEKWYADLSISTRFVWLLQGSIDFSSRRLINMNEGKDEESE